MYCRRKQEAYGVVAYLQSKGKVAFAIDKSRLSPMKNLRLELKAAVATAQLSTFIISALQP